MWFEPCVTSESGRPARPGREPLANGAHVRQAPARAARPRTHLDGVAAEPVHRAKAELVGRVVADEHGNAAAKRPLAQEFPHAPALVFAGRSQLHDVLTPLDAEA